MLRNKAQRYDPNICCSAYYQYATKKCLRFATVNYHGFPLCPKHEQELKNLKQIIVKDGSAKRPLHLLDRDTSPMQAMLAALKKEAKR
jgi:hypothetical protein